MLRPGGKAQFGDQILDVVADGAFLQPGVSVRIVELQGTRVVVELARENA
jgi:membrane-bound ClpP family serine protease